jgi:hypothetical protein
MWNDDVPVKNRLALLKDFLDTLRYTKVFKNFALDFLKDVYTGIEKNQTIEDIVDWWGTAHATAPSSAPKPAVQSKNVYRIGDIGPAGGIVFYDNGSYSNGWRYLEAAPSEMDRVDTNTFPATSLYATLTDRTFGAGLMNTRVYLEKLRTNGVTGNTAPQVCNTLVCNGYNDWYLPSLDELLRMYTVLHDNRNAGFLSRKYWTSTCYSNNEAFPGAAIFVDFSDGTTGLGDWSGTLRIRACRQF